MDTQSASTDCLGENTIEAMTRGALSPDAREAAVLHLDRCEDCRVLLAALGHAAVTAPNAPAGSPSEAAAHDRPRAHLPPGSRVGRYTVLHEVGAGAMGVVYAAYDPELDRRIALKLVHHGALSRTSWDEAASRLQREAQALARLPHPNVITVFDVGRFEELVFLAMEFMEGGTLGEWLRAGPHSPSLVLQMFLDAGRGLVAVHAEGIVHRDFKPENVLIGKDGRARVTDFGLARIAAESGGCDHTAGNARPLPAGVNLRTQTGAVLGTPAYAAPELWRGVGSDARSDQFAYCVALFEALHGERPFTIAEIAGASELVAPRGEHIPPAIQAVLARGLAAAPNDRFASMQQLLDAIEQALAPRRRRTIALVAGLAAVAMIAAGTLALRREASPGICGASRAALAGVWDVGQRVRLGAAFATAGAPGVAAWTGTAALLDRYADGWTRMHTEACEATHVRGEQSGELLDLRMACLGQRRQQLAALLALLGGGERDVVDHSAAAAGQLPSLEDCASREALTAPLRLPANPVVRIQIAAARTRLAHAAALLDAARYEPSRALSEQVIGDVQALDYRPLEAEAFLTLGIAHIRLAQSAKAEPALRRALVAAQASGHLTVAARAAIQLAFVDGLQLRHHADGQLWLDLAGATIERIGDASSLVADHAYVLGKLLDDERKTAQALPELQRALAIEERTFGAEHPAVARTLGSLAEALARLERFPEALAASDRAVAIEERLLGPDHPDLAKTLQSAAFILNYAGRPADAERVLERALAINERAYGPDHPALVRTLTVLSNVQTDPIQSTRTLLRARSLLERSGGSDHADMAIIDQNLAILYSLQGRRREQREHAQNALRIQDKLFGPSALDLVGPLIMIGNAITETGQPERALGVLERAFAIAESQPLKDQPLKLRHVRVELRLQLADTLWKSGRDRARARSLMTSALELARGGGPSQASNITEAEKWLAAHRRP